MDGEPASLLWILTLTWQKVVEKEEMPEGAVGTKTPGLVFSAAVFCGLEDVSPEPEMLCQHQIYSTDAEEVNTRNLTIVF